MRLTERCTQGEKNERRGSPRRPDVTWTGGYSRPRMLLGVHFEQPVGAVVHGAAGTVLRIELRDERLELRSGRGGVGLADGLRGGVKLGAEAGAHGGIGNPGQGGATGVVEKPTKPWNQGGWRPNRRKGTDADGGPGDPPRPVSPAAGACRSAPHRQARERSSREPNR